MLQILTSRWWVLLLRGLAAIVFAVATFVWPEAAVAALVLLFGAYVLIDGVLSVIAGVASSSDSERWWWLLLEGLAGIIVGVLAFVYPGPTLAALVTIVAAWAAVTGIFEIITAIRLRKEIEGELVMLLMGLASILLALLMALYPGVTAAVFVWMVAAYALVFGVLEIILAFRVRRLHRELFA